jgi:hypothetical protein
MRMPHHPIEILMINLKRDLLGPTITLEPTELSISYLKHRPPLKEMFHFMKALPELGHPFGLRVKETPLPHTFCFYDFKPEFIWLLKDLPNPLY